MNGMIGIRRSVHAQHTQRQFVVLGECAQTVQRRGYGNTDPLCKCQKFVICRRRLPPGVERLALVRRHRRLETPFAAPCPAEGLDVVEHASWTALASMILNLDETITRE